MVAAVAGTRFEIGGSNIREGAARCGGARSRSERNVVVIGNAQPPAARAHIVDVDHRARSELSLDSEIPLHRVWIPQMRIEVALHSLEGIGSGKRRSREYTRQEYIWGQLSSCGPI